MKSIEVNTASACYKVVIDAGLLAHPDRLGAQLDEVIRGARRALVVFDAGVPESYQHTVLETASSRRIDAHAVVLTPTEPDKSLDTLAVLLEQAAVARLDRDDVVIAVGGGIVGDVAGFAAATYRRGIRVVQCPTTLLAMVDASVGGKTGVNLRVGIGDTTLKKNMVGAFWQPSRVIADVEVLSSLDDRHFRCGLGECIKHAMLAEGFGVAGLLAFTEQNIDAVRKRDAKTLIELVARNVAVKATVVAQDEREDDRDSVGRAALNLGHTFAHVFETMHRCCAPGEPDLLHGEAVAVGLRCALELSRRCNFFDGNINEYQSRVDSLIRKAGLPLTVCGVGNPAGAAEAMLDDKKVRAGVLRLVVPVQSGCVDVRSDVARKALEQAVQVVLER